MSSILKALRRLEEERARKSQVAPGIAASLLRRGVQRRQLPLWVWPTVIIVVALTLAALLWPLRPALVKIEKVSQGLVPAPPPTKISLPSSAGQGGEMIIEEVMDQRRPVLLPRRPSPAAAPALPLARVIQATPGAAATAKAATEAINSTVIAIEERQSPVVSAIAWQEESPARMAVIDGLPVMTGETVGRAIVEEIQRDRILFREEGILFMVRIEAP